MGMKYLIIGSGTAGTRAALEAKKKDRQAMVTMVSESTYPEYSPCALPFVLEGKIKDFTAPIVHPPEFYQKLAKVELRLEEKVTKIKDASVETDKGEIDFDKLLVATGAKPFVPPIPGAELENVSTLWSMDDAKKIQKLMKASKTAVVIGSGLIGLEAAIAFTANKIKTTVVELLPTVFPVLDSDISSIVQKYLEDFGINFLLNEKVTEIKGKDRAEKVLTEKNELKTDLVVIATGVKPNTTLAKDSGIKIGETGGIKTDNLLQTNKQNIYSAGNCTEVTEFFSGKPILSQLGTTAERQGLVAGLNLTGMQITFQPVLNSTVAKLHDLEIGSVGLSSNLAEKLEIPTKSAKFTGKHLPEYYPGGKDITVKLLSDDTGKLVGAQLAGTGVLERLEALTFGMQKNLTVKELALAEMPYTPPLCPTVDPIRIAASLLIRKIK